MMWHCELAKQPAVLYLKRIYYGLLLIYVFHHMWHMEIYDLLLVVPHEGHWIISTLGIYQMTAD